ncbi:uncharacterized protein At2g29880-like [Neltuma alba]|uniref:uncharacterized protein At2g29880-like n=1 Tax=Neltuma alba TaxID=207710 RepID=UPI0010A36FD4|nr:uncharacterized protein At2g29880-like [Prosopis alba]
MDDYLVDAFMEQYNCGNKVNGTFTTTAYENIVKEMSALLDIEMDKEKIKNRWKTLKKNFSEIYDIFKNGLSGFAWNPSTQLWEAEDEVWDQLIESKPKAANWRDTPFPNYNKMIILYGNNRASGEGTHTIGEMRKRHHSINEEDFLDTGNNTEDVASQHNINMEHFEILDNSVNQDNSLEVASASSKKKQKVNSNKEKDSELSEIKDVMSEIAQAIRESTRKIPQVSGEEVWNMIKDCGVSTTYIAKIYKALMGDDGLLRTFVECPLVGRKDLLMEIMNDLGN